MPMDDATEATSLEGDVNDIDPPLFALNANYAVLLSNGHLCVLDIATQRQRSRDIWSNSERWLSLPMLAISKAQREQLAVSAGAQVLLYDLRTLSLVVSLPGIGRSVSSLAWSFQHGNRLASGCINGTVAIWDTRLPRGYPLRLRTRLGPCSAITFHPNKDDILAAVHGSHIHVWNLASASQRPVAHHQLDSGPIYAIGWQPGSNTYCLAIALSRSVVKYDASTALWATNNTGSPDDSDDSENMLFDRANQNPRATSLLSATMTESALSAFQWLDPNLVLGLTRDGRQAVVFDNVSSGNEINLLASCDLGQTACEIQLHHVHGTICLLSFGVKGAEIHDLPTTVLRRLPSTPEATRIVGAATHSPSLHGEEAIMTAVNPKSFIPDGKMNPGSISSRPLAAVAHSKLARWKTKETSQGHQTEGLRDSKNIDDRPDPSTHNVAMTSSLELPGVKDSGPQSPIPFLSPSIPAQNSPQTVVPTLDDSELELSPQLGPWREASTTIATTAAQDDDSDDDSLAAALQTSGTFLPGGINVPLPKACGALFSSTGPLLTFFPRRTPTVVQILEPIQNEKSKSKTRKPINKVAKLFPTFGLMLDYDTLSGDETSSLNSSDLKEEERYNEPWTRITALPSSFPSQQSWQARVSPSKAEFVDSHLDNRLIVKTYDLNGPGLNMGIERKLAENYRVLKKDNESGSDVCYHNATWSDNVGLKNIAHIWRLVALLLADKVPLELMGGNSAGVDRILVVARKASEIAYGHAGIPTTQIPKERGPFGLLRWADNPFGSKWLVRRIFDWLERYANIQVLATLSAVLATLQGTQTLQPLRAHKAYLQDPRTSSLHYFANTSAITVQRPTAMTSIPTLNTSPERANTSLHISPSKQHRSSVQSSREPSQPTTPYLESSSTTPPFFLPNVSRQGSRLSTSGSASPEASRSSFSAAARHYAQSITDKFGLYGTSPPPKKLASSVSPHNNELSSSLLSGSWSKSVSFATLSTDTSTARGSLLSTSYEEKDIEDPYDSDKTVEDSSLPHTPKSATGEIAITEKNQSAFCDEISGAAESAMLPDDLTSKARYWSQYYADQLRAWGLLTEATEMEKVMGMSTALQKSSMGMDEIGMMPTLRQQKSRVGICAICTIALQSLIQFCPSCTHSYHIECLYEYCAGLDFEDFECPAGCGCRCSDLPYVIQEVRPPSSGAKHARKKTSFTDPRRWRARVEGDSW
jgi:hypothetical protein